MRRHEWNESKITRPSFELRRYKVVLTQGLSIAEGDAGALGGQGQDINGIGGAPGARTVAELKACCEGKAGDGIRTCNLLITNQLRYHCATPASNDLFYPYLLEILHRAIKIEYYRVLDIT
jgi:hypothetical protein